MKAKELRLYNETELFLFARFGFFCKGFAGKGKRTAKLEHLIPDYLPKMAMNIIKI